MPDRRLTVSAEWEPHDACWMAFPYLEREWGADLERAQRSIISLAKTISGRAREPVKLMVRNDTVLERARAMIGSSPGIELVRGPYADCWVRDTWPILGKMPGGAIGAAHFVFNAWGNKFDLADDVAVGAWAARQLGAELLESSLVLEGGAVEFNGMGLCLTTESCLLNPNRNPGRSGAAVEKAIADVITVDRFIWLPRGLRRDHTDGHVDMIARFVEERTVVCMLPTENDPNRDILHDTAERLGVERGLELVTVPSPGRVDGPHGGPLPASYCNFYIGNRAVIVPTYGVPSDAAALQTLQGLFPEREVIGLDARPLLSQGGAFHCVTQPQPALR